MRLVERLKEMDYRTKVRLFLILLVAQLVLIFVILGAVTITSQPSFCNICHEMRADVRSWEASSHAEVTCYGCHSEGGTLAFLAHKVSNLKEPYYHLTNSFKKPINGDGEYGRKISNEPCKRCHSQNRKVTPSKGVIIDHLKHEEKNITCVTCHNRVAHPDMKGYPGEREKTEVRQITLKPGVEQPIPPATKPYQDRLKMRSCMTCHTGEKEKAPRDCKTCHPPGFKLNPHPDATIWFSVHGREAKPDIGNCVSCHQQKDCNSCHRTEMPHPPQWKEGHGGQGKVASEECKRCHVQANYCEACHHRYDPARGPWYSLQPGLSVHPAFVRERGAGGCFDCHNPVYCARCHVRGKVD